jgi:hypothetical protein
VHSHIRFSSFGKGEGNTHVSARYSMFLTAGQGGRKLFRTDFAKIKGKLPHINLCTYNVLHMVPSSRSRVAAGFRREYLDFLCSKASRRFLQLLRKYVGKD